MTLRRATAADAAAIAAVHVACWREAYAGILSEGFLAGLSETRRAVFWQRHIGSADDLGTFVALHDDDVVGFANGTQHPDAAQVEAGFPGYIGAIYLLRRVQRQGLGRALMAAVSGALLGAGLPAASLWVLQANAPARRFYEALGGEACGTQLTDIAGQQLPEVAYGWRDLDRLVAPTR